MQLPPFLLDEWLAAHEFASPPIRYNLASSTGPGWTLAELTALGDGRIRSDLEEMRLSYAPPEGAKPLRERIAQFYDVDPDWVIVTTGASEALSMLYCLHAEAGDSILLPSPAFPAMPVMARAWGLKVSNYKLRREEGFRQSADHVLAGVESSTRLVLINTPHNPTGSVMAAADLKRLAASLADRGIAMLVDEVYHPLYFGSSSPSAARLPGAIVVSDFSKALSLAGLRIGWIIDGDARRRERLINLRRTYLKIGQHEEFLYLLRPAKWITAVRIKNVAPAIISPYRNCRSKCVM